MPESAALPAAVRAFAAEADRFDARFGGWHSVAAQRRAVRRCLLDVFPPGSVLLELAGGTGEDAIFLARAGRRVHVTDGARTMVERIRRKVLAAGLSAAVTADVVLLERLAEFAASIRGGGGASFDGAYSNFAGLNCVADLRVVARPLSHLLPVGAAFIAVLFGPHPPGELLVQLARRDRVAALRRARRTAPARLGGHDFDVFYPRPGEIAAAFAPWFSVRRTRGIGILVPPSAAEPFISRFPRLVRTLELIDRVLAGPLAHFGDHVLLHFERTAVPPPASS
jgi:hypothetical protein